MSRLMVELVRRRTHYMTGTKSNDIGFTINTGSEHGCELGRQQPDGMGDVI